MNNEEFHQWYAKVSLQDKLTKLLREFEQDTHNRIIEIDVAREVGNIIHVLIQLEQRS